MSRVILVEHLVRPMHCFEDGTGSGKLRPFQQDAESPHACSLRTGPEEAEDLVLVEVERMSIAAGFADDPIHHHGPFVPRRHATAYGLVRARNPGNALSNSVRRTFEDLGRFEVTATRRLVGLAAQDKLEVAIPDRRQAVPRGNEKHDQRANRQQRSSSRIAIGSKYRRDAGSGQP